MKLKIADLSTPHNPTWCPGCGDYGIWGSIKNALVELNLDPNKTAIVYGIGCSGNMCNTIHTYGFHGVHGRSLPVAEGIKLVNPELTVIAVVGDGDQYGEGLNHLIHACRGNHDITCIVHNNEVYGLTTGQVSPTAEKGHTSKSTPDGIIETPINPIATTITAGATFVARGFSGNPSHLKDLIVEAIRHKGFSHVDVLQNCVTFNKYNTFEYYQERTYVMKDHNVKDKNSAFSKSWEWEDKIPIGIFYKSTRKDYRNELDYLEGKSIVRNKIKPKNINRFLASYR